MVTYPMCMEQEYRGQRLKREDGALDCEGPYLLCQRVWWLLVDQEETWKDLSQEMR